MSTTTADATTRVPSLAWVLAGLSAAAGVIHFAVLLEHNGNDVIVPIGFALAGWIQLAIAGVIIARRPSPALYWLAIGANLSFLAVWAWSRTAGLPFDPYNDVAEPVGALDLTTAILQAAAIVVAATLLLAPDGVRFPSIVSLVVGLELLALATIVMIAGADSTGGHSHGGAAETASAPAASSGHSHGGDAMAASTGSGDHAAEMVRIDRSRCDLGFNPAAYWNEASATGVDTYAGGAMAADEHASATPAGEVTKVDPLGGRGSAQLDKLVSLTSQGSAEAVAAELIVELANSSDVEYDAWRTWLKTEGIAGAGHTHAAADPAAPTTAQVPAMGHPGPSTWEAMTDPAQCAQLTEELELARETALKYPTVADATKAGWFRVTPYVPGIAAHYMNFGLVDGKFEIDKPEMLLYDGTKPESRIVGLSYYIFLDGTAQPTQGFTGDNDHYHRHFGLCIGRGGVIGDSATTEEECAAMGGRKASGTEGWMSHAWVVPGCESPWGVFSGENPILDDDLGKATGTNDGGCSASGVSGRYDLSPGQSDLATSSLRGVASGK
jgi:hypothetical protein